MYSRGGYTHTEMIVISEMHSIYYVYLSAVNLSQSHTQHAGDEHCLSLPRFGALSIHYTI